MKKKIMSVLLCLALLITIAPKPKAHADALTASMIGQIAYAMGTSWGINFNVNWGTGEGVTDFISGQVEDYVNSKGGSITSLFGGEMARIASSKLVVGQQLYNGVSDFISWLGEKYRLGDVVRPLNGTLGGTPSGTYKIGQEGLSISAQLVGARSFDSEYLPVGYAEVDWYLNGNRITSAIQGYDMYFPPDLTWSLSLYRIRDNYWYDFRISTYMVSPTYGTTRDVVANYTIGREDTASMQNVSNVITWDGTNYQAPQPLPQNKEWQGDFSDTPGFAEPPTDLPDFLSRIPVGIAENNLAVTGEIVEADTGGDMPTPSPSPSPSPSYNKSGIALIIAEILALINSLSGDTAVDTETIEQVAQEVAEQAQTVPDTITQTATQTQEAIQDATQTITETMTQTQTQTQTAIQDATQTITDTITQTQTETKDVIQDQTQEITDIKDSIKDATDVPTRDKWEQVKKDLHGVFPFCIPWDIYGMLTAFSAEPRAPHFEYPFQIPSIGLDYTLELDFAEFDPVAQILRTVELIAFSIGLAILTSKVIRW